MSAGAGPAGQAGSGVCVLFSLNSVPSCQNKITHKAKSTRQSQGKVYAVNTNFGSFNFFSLVLQHGAFGHPKHPVGQQGSAAVAGIKGLQGMVWGSWCLREQDLPLHQLCLGA